MKKYTEQNKLAWEYNTYNFWVNQIGTPSERAKMDMQNPRAMLKNYSKYFDIVFMEGGILHYFHDIDSFMKIINKLLKNNGKMICSDFHPIRKCVDINWCGSKELDYFSTDIVEGEMPHAKFYDNEIRKQFPKCSLRLYTLSEIINSVINGGFNIKSFEEYPAWTNNKLPGEFTSLAYKTN